MTVHPAGRGRSVRSPQYVFGALLLGPAGRWFLARPHRLADQAAFAGRLLLVAVQGASISRRAIFLRLILNEVYTMASASWPLVSLIGLSMGYLWAVIWFGSLSNLGGLDAMSSLLLRVETLEISPIFTAMVVIIRYGAPMTWEVAIMKSGHQFITLSGLGIPPEHYLGVPRVAGALLAFPPLLALFNLASILGAYLGAWNYTDRPMWDFLYALSASSTPDHLIKMAFKSFLGSLSIAFFCFYNGSQMPLEGLPTHSGRVMRAAMGESLFYAVLSSVLVSIFYG